MEDLKENVLDEFSEKTNDIVENNDEATLEEGTSAEELAYEIVNASSTRYINYSDKYEDAKSTAATLLIVGVAGLLLIAGSVSGILDKFVKVPVKFEDNFLLYIVMTLLFAIFTVIGVIYVFISKDYKSKISGEVSATENITNYLKNYATKESIDHQIEGEFSEEEMYFRRFEILKNILMREYENADEALIEKLIDQYYDDVFNKTQELS